MSLLRNRWLHVVTLALLSGAVMTASQAAQPHDRFKSLWSDLASEEEGKANRALLALAATPKETIAFLQLHLRPVKVEPERVARLVMDLDSTTFSERDAASKELEYLGKFAKPLIEKHLKDNPSVEVKQRLNQLLKRIPPEPAAPGAAKATPPLPLQGRSVGISNNNGRITITIDGQVLDLANLAPPPPPTPPSPNLGWLRASRAVIVLEHLGTPAARQILREVAQGEADAPPTKAAREALERLGKDMKDAPVKPKKL